MASPETVRLSIAAAMTLGFKRGKFYRNAKLGCINLLMEYDEGCVANCLYCGQAREISNGPECKSLIRVQWPSYPLCQVIATTKKAAEKDPFIQRVCISAITSPKAPKDLVRMVKEVKDGTGLKVSTLITPTLFKKDDFEAIKAAGAENITVAVDAATPQIFDKLRGKQAKGPHKWDHYLGGIKDALEVLGNGGHAVGVHLIIGLGETEEEAVRFIQSCYDEGARVHLFSFYPEKGVAMEDMPQPPLEQYRRIQLARHLIDQGKSRFEKMKFESGRLTDFGLPRNALLQVLRKGAAFMTTGCTGCNRPYANETPTQAMRGFFRNYPFPPNTQDIQAIEKQMGIQI
jgi:biotin synthase-related radical SAM superfamily protein